MTSDQIDRLGNVISFFHGRAVGNSLAVALRLIRGRRDDLYATRIMLACPSLTGKIVALFYLTDFPIEDARLHGFGIDVRSSLAYLKAHQPPHIDDRLRWIAKNLVAAEVTVTIILDKSEINQAELDFLMRILGHECDRFDRVVSNKRPPPDITPYLELW